MPSGLRYERDTSTTKLWGPLYSCSEGSLRGWLEQHPTKSAGSSFRQTLRRVNGGRASVRNLLAKPSVALEHHPVVAAPWRKKLLSGRASKGDRH